MQSRNRGVMTAFRLLRRMSISLNARPLAGSGCRIVILAISVAAGAFLGPYVRADEFDALNFALGSTVSYDSNVFRTPDSTSPQPDTIYTGYVGLRFDKPYAQQRFQADITETATRYQTSSQLDFDGLTYRAAWLWHLTPRLNGTLSADHSESSVSFADTTGTNRNIRTTENRIFNLDGELSARWHLLFGISQADQTSEAPTQGVPDFHSNRVEAGVRYVTTSGNTLSFVQRMIRGDYVNVVLDPNNPVNDDFRGYNSEFQANWVLNAKSELTGRLAWIDRRSDHFSQFDFSGLAGALDYVWTPVSKLTVDFGARRELLPWQELDASYRVDSVISFAPTWRASNRITLRAHLEHTESDFRGGSAPNGSSRSDTANSMLVGVSWLPLRSLTLGASLQEERRSSSDALMEYDATVATISAALLF